MYIFSHHLQVVQYGNASRSTGVSGNNSQSSRSHAVLQLEVRDAKDCKVGRLVQLEVEFVIKRARSTSAHSCIIHISIY